MARKQAGQGGAQVGELTEGEIQAAQAARPEAQAAAEPAAEVAPALAPGPIVITDPEALQFVYDGRQRLTALGLALRNLREWSEVFELRGGAAVYGEDALGIVYLYNAMAAFATEDRMAVFRRLRTDI
jgi:hypothetical protein